MILVKFCRYNSRFYKKKNNAIIVGFFLKLMNNIILHICLIYLQSLAVYDV